MRCSIPQIQRKCHDRSRTLRIMTGMDSSKSSLVTESRKVSLVRRTEQRGDRVTCLLGIIKRNLLRQTKINTDVESATECFSFAIVPETLLCQRFACIVSRLRLGQEAEYYPGSALGLTLHIRRIGNKLLKARVTRSLTPSNGSSGSKTLCCRHPRWLLWVRISWG